MMKFDLKKVQWSKNDIKWGIKVPEDLTEELAYFLGFHVGDGYMKIKRRATTVDYAIHYDGHQINEKKWYHEYLKPFIKELFNKDVYVAESTRGTVRIVFRSKAIVTFLNRCCDLGFSPKYNVDIPKIIKEAAEKFQASFLKGLADTDFSLSFTKNGKYPRIEHTTCSRSLHESLLVLLRNVGFQPYHIIRETQRNGIPHTIHIIQISGKAALNKWMKNVGFESYNVLTRYLVWKETGSLAPGTDINDRIKILKERGIEIPPPYAPNQDRTGDLYQVMDNPVTSWWLPNDNSHALYR